MPSSSLPAGPSSSSSFAIPIPAVFLASSSSSSSSSSSPSSSPNDALDDDKSRLVRGAGFDRASASASPENSDSSSSSGSSSPRPAVVQDGVGQAGPSSSFAGCSICASYVPASHCPAEGLTAKPPLASSPRRVAPAAQTPPPTPADQPAPVRPSPAGAARGANPRPSQIVLHHPRPDVALPSEVDCTGLNSGDFGGGGSCADRNKEHRAGRDDDDNDAGPTHCDGRQRQAAPLDAPDQSLWRGPQLSHGPPTRRGDPRCTTRHWESSPTLHDRRGSAVICSSCTLGTGPTGALREGWRLASRRERTAAYNRAGRTEVVYVERQRGPLEGAI
jgi:hypothetical protein